MAREYDHLFKLLIIGDSGEACNVAYNLLRVYVKYAGELTHQRFLMGHPLACVCTLGCVAAGAKLHVFNATWIAIFVYLFLASLEVCE